MQHTLSFLLAALGLTACALDCPAPLPPGWQPTVEDLFVYPLPGMTQRNRHLARGYQNRLPLQYRPYVLFARDFESLDGAGQSGPILYSDAFATTFFGFAQPTVRVLDTLGNEAAPLIKIRTRWPSIRGYELASPLAPATRYWIVFSGQADEGCEPQPPVVLAPEEGEEQTIRTVVGLQKQRTIVLPFRTQSSSFDLAWAAGEAERSPVPRVLNAQAYPVTDGSRFNPTLARRFPPLVRGIRYGESPWMPLDAVGQIVLGQVALLDFRRGGRIAPTAMTPLGTQVVPFILTLPRVNPARRPRLVLFSHPLRACKESMLGLANMLAANGFAAAAIDHVEHGARQSNPPDDYVCGSSTPWEFFGRDPLQLRDNLRASALDQFQFRLALQRTSDENFDFDGDGRKDVLTDRPALVAMSLGSMVAAPLLTLAPDIEAAVLNTATGTALELLNAHIPFAASYAIPGPNPYPSLNLATLQALLDGAEPLNFVPGLQRPNLDLLVQEALGDEIVPNDSTARLALATHLTLVAPIEAIPGLPIASPPFQSRPTRALVQVRANHSFLLLPKDKRVLEPAKNQIGHFLRTHFESGQGEAIPITVPP